MLIFILIFLLFEFLVGKILAYPVSKQIENKEFYPAVRWNEFYGMKDNSIDLLFLGSSHAYRGFDPKIFDKILNINSFNLGSSSQTPAISYYVLKEALNSQNPDIVIYEVYWPLFNRENEFNSTMYNYDYIRNEHLKKEMLLNTLNLTDYISVAFDSYRYRNNYQLLFDLVFNINKKETKEYYKSKGFVFRDEQNNLDELRNNNLFENENYRTSKFENMQMKYFNKTIKLAKRNNIDILLVTVPIPKYSLSKVNDYLKINKTFKEIADHHNINYLDYNLINRINLKDKKHFYDDNHINYKGVKIINSDIVYYLKNDQ